MHIERLELQTADLAGIVRFYGETLSLPVEEQSSERATLRVGRSRLTFAVAPDYRPVRCHFAFTIPENRMAEAKAWLTARVPPIQNASGEDEYFFPAWNAHAVYFYDPDGNIGELIARHTLPNATDDTAFDARHFLNISEIGLVTEDVPGLAQRMRDTLSATNYYGGSDTFTAVGDENGLLILVATGRRWFQTDHAAEPVRLHAAVASAAGQTFTLTGPPYAAQLT